MRVNARNNLKVDKSTILKVMSWIGFWKVRLYVEQSKILNNCIVLEFRGITQRVVQHPQRIKPAGQYSDNVKLTYFSRALCGKNLTFLQLIHLFSVFQSYS